MTNTDQFLLNLQKLNYLKALQSMKRPLSAVQTAKTQFIQVKAKQKHQEQFSYQEGTENYIDDQLEIKSNISNSKRMKLPATMKTFLKNRKFIRQANKNKQEIGMNTLKQIIIENSNKNQQINNKNNNFDAIKNQTNLGFAEGQFEHGIRIENLMQNNNSQIPIKQQKILKPPQSRQESFRSRICSICEGPLSQTNQIKAFTCRHMFCDQCIKSYIKYKINLFQEVKCPEESCEAFLNTEIPFYKSFSKRQRRNYKKIHNFYMVQTDQSKKLCPKQQCDGIISLKQNTSNQECQKCKSTFCSVCFFETHQGPCRDYQIKYMEDNLHYRQCSKCHIIVQRMEGCNHITCKCGYQFCYICGSKWQHDHLCRFNPNDDDSGCDWGQSWQDHFWFLIKLPFKFIITTIYTSFWLVISFAAAPYNIFFFLYWILLILVGGPVVYIFQDEDTNIWKILLLFLIFPLLMIYCLPLGIGLFLTRFQEQCPYISDGYRLILRF